MNEDDGNRIPAMVSHLVLTTIVVETLPDHATTNAPHIRWCRRLLMQVKEFAAEPAETCPAWSAFSILVFVFFRRSEDLFASLCGAVARLARPGAAMTCVARWRL